MKPSYEPTAVKCKDCGVIWMKRKDSIKSWQRRCRACATAKVAARPDMKERLSANGRNVMARGNLRTPIENRRRGSNHPNWRGGVTPEHLAIRWSLQMDLWRRAVFARDKFCCVACGINNQSLQADHIKSFSLFPRLRFDVDNGRTLCKPCHRKFGVKVRGGKIIKRATFDYRNGTNWTVIGK
jgi:hypothetical protein